MSTVGPRDAEATRTTVRTWWEETLAGTRTRAETSRWAQQQIDAGWWDEELVLQGLLQLQALDIAGDAGAAADSDNALQESLDAWLSRLDRYDENPAAWRTDYFTTMLRSFANRHGIEAAERFSAKMVGAGLLSTSEVQGALDHRQATESASPVRD
jgi:hypothetical protein